MGFGWVVKSVKFLKKSNMRPVFGVYRGFVGVWVWVWGAKLIICDHEYKVGWYISKSGGFGDFLKDFSWFLLWPRSAFWRSRVLFKIKIKDIRELFFWFFAQGTFIFWSRFLSSSRLFTFRCPTQISNTLSKTSNPTPTPYKITL